MTSAQKVFDPLPLDPSVAAASIAVITLFFTAVFSLSLARFRGTI